MVFKKPRNSRDDKSNRSSNRAPKGDDQPKKAGISSFSKPSNPDFDKPGDKPKRNNYGSEAGSREKSSPSERRKPYSGRPDPGDIRPTGRTSGASTPYRGKSNSDERPKRSFSGE